MIIHIYSDELYPFYGYFRDDAVGTDSYIRDTESYAHVEITDELREKLHKAFEEFNWAQDTLEELKGCKS